MPSSLEPVLSPLTLAAERQVAVFTVVRGIAFCWGFSAFLPVGVMYLNLLLMLLALLFVPGIGTRVAAIRHSPVFWPIVLMLAWSALAALVGAWMPDTSTRLFHLARVALLLCMGMLLAPPQARAALAGFLVAAVLAALVVAVHHVWPLPAWAIWSSLLTSRNNFSSGNMITMATASGVCLYLGLGRHRVPQDRWLALAAALALALTVALHSVSRNSQLLLGLLLLAAVVCRYRSWRAALAGALVVLALAAAMWQFSATTKSRFIELAGDLQNATSGASYATSGGVRWRMYQEAVQGMLEHPVLGTGVGSWLPHWRSVWMGMQVDMAPATKLQFADINNPHNDFLLAGMETGVPGLLLLAWLLLRFVRLGWQQGSEAGGITVLLGVALFATCLVNAPLRDAALGMTLLWLLGVALAAQGSPRHA